MGPGQTGWVEAVNWLRKGLEGGGGASWGAEDFRVKIVDEDW